MSLAHTVAIWTFTFHKISGFVRVILKENFKQFYRPKVSIFSSENSDSLSSFSFQFLQNLSNPLLFTHCCCYFKELTYLKCDFCIKTQFKHVNSSEQQQQCVKSSGFDKFCKKQKKIEYSRFELPAQKSDRFGLQVELKIVFKITITKPDFFWEM